MSCGSDKSELRNSYRLPIISWSIVYPIIDIPDNVPDLQEQQGTKPKSWIYLNNEGYLFKIGRENTGENWAEVVACALCELLGLPHVHYDFAVWKQKKGVISKNFVPVDARLEMGNELLSTLYGSYPAAEKYKVKDHTLNRVFTLLNSSSSDFSIQLPMGWSAPSSDITRAIDMFIGYLLLDAWIANQDRHHENWGVIYRNNQIYLAPTYDHAASMGQNEQDKRRHEALTTRDKNRDINCYIKKANAAIYAKKSDSKPMSTLDAFQQFGRRRPTAAHFWLQRLSGISAQQCETVFQKIPPEIEITKKTIEFSLKLLELNKQRLLEVTL